MSIFFKNTTFNELADFSNTTWQDISFENADLKQVQFPNVKRLGMSISFKDAEFKGEADFSRADFSRADFSRADFSRADFAKEHFSEADLAKEDLAEVDFTRVNFSDEVTFVAAKFGKESYFLYTKFNGNAYFNHILAPEAERFSFKGAYFGSIFVISSAKEISCAMDFMEIDAKNSLNLGNIYCTFRRKHKDLPNHKCLSKIWKWLTTGFQTPKYPKDITRLRELKKIAQAEKDHLRALNYRIQEMQAKRWQDTTGKKTWRFLKPLWPFLKPLRCFLKPLRCFLKPLWCFLKLLKAFPEFVFWLFSCYGRSISVPACWLLVMTLGMGLMYCNLLSANPNAGHLQKQESCSNEQFDYYDALAYSTFQTFPWTPVARNQQEFFQKTINYSSSKNCILFLSFLQTLFGALLLFLFGLGARNRFLL